MHPVRIFIGVDDDTGTFIPLNVDANGNMGVNVEGELAVGELQLAAADPGLVALATSIQNGKTLADIVTALTSSSSIVSGTVSAVANASTAVPLASSQACSEVTMQAPSENTATVLFGGSTTTCYMELMPGKDYTVKVNNVNLLYVKSQTAVAQTINFIARA